LSDHHATQVWARVILIVLGLEKFGADKRPTLVLFSFIAKAAALLIVASARKEKVC